MSRGFHSRVAMGQEMFKAADLPEGFKRGDCFVNGDYAKEKRLGSGSYSTVYMAKQKEDQKLYAVKVVKKAKLDKADKIGLQQEISILRSLDNPLVMKLYHVYDSINYYQLVTELVEGGELFQRIVEKESYSELEARKVVTNLLTAVAYLHANNVVHRDLKPENVLMVSKTDDAAIKLVDFGFAKERLDGKELESSIGTPSFAAPEVLCGRPYNDKVDVWSTGVIVYMVLCGYPPFYDKNQAHLYKKIKQGRYAFHAKTWGHTSLSVRDLIHKMLTVDPDKRASSAELLRHPWFSEDILHISLATHTVLKASGLRYGAPTGPHANPAEHADYDTQVEGLPVDTTGDGIADAIGFDTTGDGNVDALDTNLDGRIDANLDKPVDVATARRASSAGNIRADVQTI